MIAAEKEIKVATNFVMSHKNFGSDRGIRENLNR